MPSKSRDTNFSSAKSAPDSLLAPSIPFLSPGQGVKPAFSSSIAEGENLREGKLCHGGSPSALFVGCRGQCTGQRLPGYDVACLQHGRVSKCLFRDDGSLRRRACRTLSELLGVVNSGSGRCFGLAGSWPHHFQPHLSWVYVFLH